MTQQYQPNLGELCKQDARRDAVHIAVAPVEVDHDCNPGTHVGVLRNVAGEYIASAALSPKVGIIDPFLKTCVRTGQRCWVFLYPNTVTSLRHSWSHPAFAAKFPWEKPS